jgi:hypothetical protein
MHKLSRLHFFAVAGGAERVGNSLYAGKSLEKYVTAGLSFDRGLPDTSKMYRRAAFHTEVVQDGLVRLFAKRLPHESFALSVFKLRQI